MPETIVLAIGGNSLITDPKAVTIGSQYEAARQTSEMIMDVVAAGHKLVISHGNGPQVGYILRRVEMAAGVLHAVPLDSCVADTQGAIGYNIQMALRNEMLKKGLNKNVATVVTQVLVDKDDPSFQKPSKPIGSFLNEQEADHHRKTDGWELVEDSGRGFRRVVASPKPKEIIELETIRALLDADNIVIAVGGGGIPVVKHADGSISGMEAVIDKDLASALLAENLGADLFVISTAVEKVSINFGKPDQKDLDTITVAEAEKYCEEGHFAPGSMLPKVQSVIDFIKRTGKSGLITDPNHLAAALKGKAGTRIIP